MMEDEEIKVAPMTKTYIENASRGAVGRSDNLSMQGQAPQKTFVQMDDMVATVYAPTSDTIDQGRRTLMDKLNENRP